MNKYEVLYIIDTKLEETAREQLIQKFNDVISNSGSIESTDKWGVKKLAYEIDNNTEGFYVLVNFTAEQDVPAELERQMKLSDRIIRYMVVRK